MLPRTDAVFQDYYRDPVAAAHRRGFTELHEILYFVRGMFEPSPLLEKDVLGRAFSPPGPALFCWIPLEARSQKQQERRTVESIYTIASQQSSFPVKRLWVGSIFQS